MTTREVEELRDRIPIGQKVMVKREKQVDGQPPQYDQARILEKFPHIFTVRINGKIRCINWVQLMGENGEARLV